MNSRPHDTILSPRSKTIKSLFTTCQFPTTCNFPTSTNFNNLNFSTTCLPSSPCDPSFDSFEFQLPPPSGHPRLVSARRYVTPADFFLSCAGRHPHRPSPLRDPGLRLQLFRLLTSLPRPFPTTPPPPLRTGPPPLPGAGPNRTSAAPPRRPSRGSPVLSGCAPSSTRIINEEGGIAKNRTWCPSPSIYPGSIFWTPTFPTSG